jgi:protoheme IX farnesyltransferase
MKRSRAIIFLELCKWRITSLSTLSAVMAYMLAGGGGGAGLLFTALGVWLLASGSAALNHYQDRSQDGSMRRTRERPLPAGKISPFTVLIFAAVLLISGITLLRLGGGSKAAMLGAVTVVWYNGVYTPLKRITAFASVPGAVVGALPPVIGWVSAGGMLGDARIWAVAFFFFIWQVPHFWLLLLRAADDFGRSDLPALTKRFSIDQLARITFVWICAALVAGLMIPLFGIGIPVWIDLALLSSAVWLAWKSKSLVLVRTKPVSFDPVFKDINIFALWVISLLSLTGLLA